jgi:hypothetical protein
MHNIIIPCFIIGSDIYLDTRNQVQLDSNQIEFVVFTFLADEVAEEENEYLTLQLIPTPATLQMMPAGEGVFFKQEINLTIMDADRAFINLI